MTIGDSTIRNFGSGNLNPLKSRSTVIFLACLFALLYINLLAWQAGFFSSEFSLVSIYIVKEIMISVTSHQKTADALPPPGLSITSKTSVV